MAPPTWADEIFGTGNVERTNAWHNAFNRLQRCY
jgi:hypothetical protein